MSQCSLKGGTEHKEDVHVEGNVQPRAMEEGCRDESPPLAVEGNAKRPHAEVLRHRTDAGRDLPQEDGDRETDERPGHIGLGDDGATADRDRLAHGAGSLTDTVGTLEAHRR